MSNFFLKNIRHFLIFLIIFLLYGCLTTSSGDAVKSLTKKGTIHNVYNKKFKGTPEFTAKTYDNGKNWQVLLKQTGVFMAPKSSKLQEIKLAGNFVARRLCDEVNMPLREINLVETSFITKAEVEGSFSCGKAISNSVAGDQFYFPNAKIFAGCDLKKENDSYAVLIANGRYETTSYNNIPNLKPAYANLESMESYVSDCLGIKKENTIILKDATLGRLNSLFGTEKNYKGKLFNSINNNEEVFIYYVGHGAPSNPPPLGDGSNFLVTADADEYDIAKTAYPIKLFYDNLSKINSDNVTIVLDTCFSGKENNGSKFMDSNASPLFNLEEEIPYATSNLNIITAGGSNEIASWTKDGNHTLLTKYFLLGSNDFSLFSNRNKNLLNNELTSYIKENVQNDAKRFYGRDQLPQVVDE